MLDLAVVFTRVGGGHKAAANALTEAASRRGLSFVLIDALDHAPRWAADAYLGVHLAGQNAAPELYGCMYASANRRDPVLDPLRHELDNLIFGSLAGRVRAAAPRVVIATHHLPLVVLGRARRRAKLAAPIVAVVTDYTAHACWAEDGVDLWAVPCAVAARELEAHGVPRARIALTGIPVREAFARIPPAPSSTPLRVLVTSGGFGAAPMTRIVRSFAGIPDVSLTVVCGAAKGLEARVRRAAERAGVEARVIGFEEDMPARMAEAHVVVGKAGGLTVTEAMTAGRPMIVASAVPGNEKVNEQRVVAAGAGIAAAPGEVGAAVDALRDRGVLAAMGRNARALAAPHAARRIVDLAHGLARSRRSAA